MGPFTSSKMPVSHTFRCVTSRERFQLTQSESKPNANRGKPKQMLQVNNNKNYNDVLKTSNY